MPEDRAPPGGAISNLRRSAQVDGRTADCGGEPASAELEGPTGPEPALDFFEKKNRTVSL